MFSIGSNQNKQRIKIKNHGINITSPYKDMILIYGHPLENDSIPLNGTITFTISADHIYVKKISLRLMGEYKLDFIQIGIKQDKDKDKDMTKGVAVVKERYQIFQCIWNNLMKNVEGEINPTISSSASSNSSSSNIFGLPFKLKRGDSGSSNPNMKIIDVRPDNLKDVISRAAGTEHNKGTYYRFHKGEYSIPYKVMLPNDIPCTIEGLQSGSILYTLESRIDIMDSNDMNSGDVSMFTNQYKYLRILRTLTMNNLTIDEEIGVSNVIRDKLQYDIKIPSRAVALGDKVPVNIRIFPFIKGLRLNKISVTLLQKYYMQNLKDKELIYDNEINIFKRSMKTFGDLLMEDNKLMGPFHLESVIELPEDLKSMTQSCDSRECKYIQVIHKLQFQLQFQRWSVEENRWKNLEIRAMIPIKIYISPRVNIKGRLVFYDQMSGKIHFRPGEMIELFSNDDEGDGDSGGYSQYYYYYTNDDGGVLPPPTYEEYNRDQLILPYAHMHVHATTTASTDDSNNNTNNNIPSYEQATANPDLSE